MKTKLTTLLLSVMSQLFSSQPLFAEPTSTPVSITSIRSVGQETYIEVGDSTLCDTNVFWLEGVYPGAKQIAATAFVAFTTNKKVQIEIRTDLGCTGWGTKIMGIRVLQ